MTPCTQFTFSRAAAGRRTRGVCSRGLTLVELLLVLVLLVVIGSLASPLLEGGFATLRLQRGTDEVLAAWSRARTLAIESGQTYQFRYQPEGRVYRIEPWPSAEQLGLDEPAVEEEETSTESDAQDTNLAETVVFASGEQIETGVDQLQQIAALNDGDRLSGGEWSAPILFFPDGTTSSATVLIKNEQDLYQRATLRSVTGVGRASEVLTEAEARRTSSR